MQKQNENLENPKLTLISTSKTQSPVKISSFFSASMYFYDERTQWSEMLSSHSSKEIDNHSSKQACLLAFKWAKLINPRFFLVPQPINWEWKTKAWKSETESNQLPKSSPFHQDLWAFFSAIQASPQTMNQMKHPFSCKYTGNHRSRKVFTFSEKGRANKSSWLYSGLSGFSSKQRGKRKKGRLELQQSPPRKGRKKLERYKRGKISIPRIRHSSVRDELEKVPIQVWR